MSHNRLRPCHRQRFCVYFCRMNKKKDLVVADALAYYREGFACSSAMLMAFADEFHLDKKQAAALATGFGSGMGHLHRTCGALSGAFMVLGLKYGNQEAADQLKKQKTYRQVRALNVQFEERHGSSICRELLKKAAADGVPKAVSCTACVRSAAALCYDALAADESEK